MLSNCLVSVTKINLFWEGFLLMYCHCLFCVYTNLNLTALQQRTNTAALFKTDKYGGTDVVHHVFKWNALFKNCQLLQ